MVRRDPLGRGLTNRCSGALSAGLSSTSGLITWLIARPLNSDVRHLLMKLHKLMALVAIMIAVPISGFGTYLWIVARAHDYRGVFGAEASEMGDLCFISALL
jgi:hypothetical protein